MTKQQTYKQSISKSPLYGYRKPTTDEFGKRWCNCATPTLTRSGDEIHQAYCLRCGEFWYN